MSITEKISHAAQRKAFETVLDSLIKKGQTQDAGKFANDLGIRSHFFHMVKYRDPDISNQNGIHSRFF